jgi:hypothetical protein
MGCYSFARWGPLASATSTRTPWLPPETKVQQRPRQQRRRRSELGSDAAPCRCSFPLPRSGAGPRSLTCLFNHHWPRRGLQNFSGRRCDEFGSTKVRSTQAHSGLKSPELAQLRPQIVPWSILCRADWVRNDLVLTMRRWLLRHYYLALGAARGHAIIDGPGQEEAYGSTNPRSLDELTQLRTHTTYYSPVLIAPL